MTFRLLDWTITVSGVSRWKESSGFVLSFFFENDRRSRSFFFLSPPFIKREKKWSQKADTRILIEYVSRTRLCMNEKLDLFLVKRKKTTMDLEVNWLSLLLLRCLSLDSSIVKHLSEDDLISMITYLLWSSFLFVLSFLFDAYNRWLVAMNVKKKQVSLVQIIGNCLPMIYSLRSLKEEEGEGEHKGKRKKHQNGRLRRKICLVSRKSPECSFCLLIKLFVLHHDHHHHRSSIDWHAMLCNCFLYERRE